MVQKSQAKINPELLKWAREECGFTHEEAVQKYFNPEKLRKAEEGKDFLTFKQLLFISKRYRRTPAFFYLKSPLKEPTIEDFRTIRAEKFHLSPILREQITSIKEKRELAVEFQKYDKNYDYSYINSITIDKNPEEIAIQVLNLLNIDLSERKKWRNEYNALNAWKNAFEKIGVFVFQISRVDIKEMRGFSISEMPYPSITLNRSDSPLGRIFTLIHEFSHIMLDKGGLCTLTVNDENYFEIERFCNAISGAVLVPEFILKNIEIVKNQKKGKDWDYDELNYLKKIFWASHEVILRRLLIIEKTNTAYYQKMRRYWNKLPKPSKGGPEKIYEKILRIHPKNYIKIVLNAMYENNITLVDVSRYLGMKLKHLDNLEQNLEG